MISTVPIFIARGASDIAMRWSLWESKTLVTPIFDNSIVIAATLSDSLNFRFCKPVKCAFMPSPAHVAAMVGYRSGLLRKSNDIIIEKNHSIFFNDLSFDFINNPDLYPTIAATCAGLGVEGRFTGLRNLIHKESDRVAAMTTELSRVGTRRATSLQFDSHDDHRIAMALAPLAMKIGAIEINNADVVSKSYPNFWQEVDSVISTEAVRRSGEISTK